MLPASGGRWRWWGEDGAGGTRTWRRGGTEGARGGGERGKRRGQRQRSCALASAENEVEPGAAAQQQFQRQFFQRRHRTGVNKLWPVACCQVYSSIFIELPISGRHCYIPRSRINPNHPHDHDLHQHARPTVLIGEHDILAAGLYCSPTILIDVHDILAAGPSYSSHRC